MRPVNGPEQELLFQIVEDRGSRVAMRVTSTAKSRPRQPATCMTTHVSINGLTGVALINTGSSINAISPVFACVANLEAFPLEKPVGLQLGCVGSRSKINYGMNQVLRIGEMKLDTYLDVVNLDHYDLVLGMPFLRQHGVSLDFKTNTARIEGSAIPVLASEEQKVGNTIPRLRARWLEKYREMLGGVPDRLPPMREINHSIPLIDESHRYRYHHPRCADALKPKLLEKINRYVDAGWWTFQNVPQAAPMMCLPK
ncbi:hypothetical protein BC629DRAFT_1299462, partial [Irpex lacteus]